MSPRWNAKDGDRNGASIATFTARRALCGFAALLGGWIELPSHAFARSNPEPASETPAIFGVPTFEDPETVDLSELINIDYQEGQPLPEKVTRLDGKRVSLKGFMSPDTKEGVQRFLLISDSCGCTGAPKVYHFVDIDLGDKVTGYRPELLTVVGTLSVSEQHDEDGYVASVYRLSAESVQ